MPINERSCRQNPCNDCLMSLAKNSSQQQSLHAILKYYTLMCQARGTQSFILIFNFPGCKAAAYARRSECLYIYVSADLGAKKCENGYVGFLSGPAKTWLSSSTSTMRKGGNDREERKGRT